MNTNPSAKRILFYGDSLVYGKKPSVLERFSSNVRFSGVLQDNLGHDYEVIEEGLRARNLFGENPFFPQRNGLETFGPIFGSHVPLDLVIIMLGTNDCNRALEKQEAELMEALGQYETKMKEWLKQLGIAGMPKLLIVSPPYIKKSEAEQNENIQRIFGPDAEERSKKLASYYKKFCQQNSVSFFDAAEVCETAPKEGIHLDEENNRKLGEALAKEVRKII